ncbi:alpha/beta hydrolase [Salipiger sp. CCB-MM3]|uniref:alpha/beta fold hydrolase n=1 Tax=Salipiger sp. CCB-MM3 TaxID=1792508 RepID=UPI00080AC07B|nr:alpha/beta hydrolase [Salipiger sp. CCB-MM3]ANT59251.1 alpha/beta hydrolase [Salipiger sp. CCB-MM3]
MWQMLLPALLLTLAGCGLTSSKAGREASGAEAAFPPEGQFLQVGDRRVHYVEKGSGPPLVLIHGASGNLRDWTFDAVARLSPRYRVIAFDRPGLGYTEAEADGDSIFEQAALLSSAAGQLGAARPIVLGQSYGGAVALAWAANHPESVSALVLLGAASQPWEGGLPLFYQITAGPLAPLANPAIAAFAPDSAVQDAIEDVFLPNPVPAGYAAHIGAPLTLRRESLAANARQRASLKAEIRTLAPRYPALDLPVELVHGEADTTVGLQIHSVPTAAQIPRANLVTLPGVGHMPQHVSPAQMDAAIARAAARAGLR